MRVRTPSRHCCCADWGFRVQETHGEKNGEPKVLRHTVLPPLPMCEKSSQGQTEIPEEIHTWKGSIFSVFSNKVANWEGSGYGALLQTPSVLFPALSSDEGCDSFMSYSSQTAHIAILVCLTIDVILSCSARAPACMNPGIARPKASSPPLTLMHMRCMSQVHMLRQSARNSTRPGRCARARLQA